MSEKAKNTAEVMASRSVQREFRKEIWRKFIAAVKNYHLIEPGDHVAVCISGGKDSLLLATCMREMAKYSDVPFQVSYLSMDPGYTKENREKMIENANKDESYIRTMEVNAGDTVRVIISKYKADGLKKQWYDMPINSVSIKDNNQTVELQIFNSLVSLTNNTPCLVYKKNRYGKESYETISLTEASSLSDDNSLFSYEIILYLDVDAKEKFTISSPERYFTWLKKEDVIIHFVKL